MRASSHWAIQAVFAGTLSTAWIVVAFWAVLSCGWTISIPDTFLCRLEPIVTGPLAIIVRPSGQGLGQIVFDSWLVAFIIVFTAVSLGFAAWRQWHS